MKINFKKSWIYLSPFVFIILLSIPYNWIYAEKLNVNIIGKLGIDLPVNATHFKINGDLQILNLKLSGDFDFRLVSQKPFSFKLFSKSLKIDSKQLLITLKKLGYLKSLPKELSGPLIAQKVNIIGNDKNYSLIVNKVSGLLFKHNKITIKGINIQIKQKNKEIHLNFNKLLWGKNKINNLILTYSPAKIDMCSDNIYLDLNLVSKTLFSFSKELKTRILSRLNKILAVRDISLNGDFRAKEFKISLLHEGRGYTLKNLSCALSTQGSSVTLFNKGQKLPSIAAFTTNSTFINYNKKLKISSNGINLNIKNIFYPKKIKEIGWESVYIPKILINTKLSYEQKNGTSNIYLQVSSIKPITLKNIKGSIITLNPTKIDIKLKDNILSILSKNVSTQLSKINYYFSPKKSILYSGINKFKDISFKINLIDKKSKLTTNYSMSNSYLKYEDITSRIKKLNIYINKYHNLLVFRSGILDAKINKKGDILAHFQCKIPLVKAKIHLREILKNLVFDINTKNILYRNMVFYSINAKKKKNKTIQIKYNTRLNNINLSGNTELDILDKEVDIITRSILIKELKKELEKNKKANKDKINKQVSLKINIPSIIWEISKHYHFEFDNISYRKLDWEYDISSLKGDLYLRDHPILGLGCYFCNLYIEAGVDLFKQGINTSIDIKGVSIPIDHLIGCFLHKAPIYLTGTTNIQLNILAHGSTFSELKNNLSFDGLLTIDNGNVLKLSNLGKKAEIVLDILHFVKLNPSKLEDSLEFNRLIASLTGGINIIQLKEIKVSSPILNLYSYGSINLNKKLIEVSGEVEKGWLSKKFHLIKNFNKKKE